MMRSEASARPDAALRSSCQAWLERDASMRTVTRRGYLSGSEGRRGRRLVVSAALAAAVAVVHVCGSAAAPSGAGAAAAWEALLKLETTASAMHTTAHPDDEHGGLLAWLSRGRGVRVSLLTLNRGEAGDNAIGSELFDGLGLIRTEELLVSDRYYGVDRQYFTTVIDYGFSKRLDEALEKWGKDHVLRDVVRIIRMDRPFVLVSRFQGNERDGHGNHQTAGLVTREAWEMAGRADVFPEQIEEGLRPWQPFKVYIGGVREDEDWTVKVDPGEYSPWLGDTYANVARLGLSFQRSQNGGRLVRVQGPAPGYYKRVGSRIGGSAREASFFDGIDTTLPGLFGALGIAPPPGAADRLRAVAEAVGEAKRAFAVSDPSEAAGPLARGLAALRELLKQVEHEPDAAFVLRHKERQFQDAINAALGVDLSAVAQPAGTPEPAGPFAAFAAPPTMGNVVPGQAFEIRAGAAIRGRGPVSAPVLVPELPAGWSLTGEKRSGGGDGPLAGAVFSVALAPDAAITSRPYFRRRSIAESRYSLLDASQFGRPATALAAAVVARYTVAGVPVEARTVVRRREANLPYGYELRELAVVPALAVAVAPATVIVPLGAPAKRVVVEAELTHNVDGETAGRLALQLPAGWSANPESHAFAFARAGERAAFRFVVSVPSLESRDYRIEAVAAAGGREYREGYEVIAHRDLETRYLYRPAATTVRGVDVRTAPGLSVGYVMGVGDQVPAGIAQLGCAVSLLEERDLASADLSRFDAIVLGTRAYAVRRDLHTYNQRLLDYARNGGNLIVLYNTQELVPARLAPYPGELPARAEEVSEEDSPVEILAPDHQAFTWPNRISKADFDGWVEQRGSKFWSTWDAAYTPMIATWDRGQAPQKGGWLTAKVGRGHYTYFAYALHRQLPYGVPGAYRLLANLLSLGKTPPPASGRR
jgi:LmbE family N-acetylglucosaminyl deacetylase